MKSAILMTSKPNGTAQASPNSELRNVFILILSTSWGFGFGFPLIIPLFGWTAVTVLSCLTPIQSCLSWSSPVLGELFVEEVIRALPCDALSYIVIHCDSLSYLEWD